MEEEEILMQELADKEEDVRPNNGAIEIDLDEEYRAYIIVFDTAWIRGKKSAKALEILRPPPKALWVVTDK
jgi:hypothetical protein